MEFQEQYTKHLEKLTKLKDDQVKMKSDMQLAYDYKENLIGKMKYADDQITEKQNIYHKILIETQDEISKMQRDFEFHVAELTPQ